MNEPAAGVGGHDLSAGGDVVERVTALARAVVGHWPEGVDAEVRLLGISENATFAVDGPAGPAVLRVHRHGYHAPGAIASELAWIDALGPTAPSPSSPADPGAPTGDSPAGAGRPEPGIRVPTVLRTTAGRRVVEAADAVTGEVRSCVLFERLDGAEPAVDDAAFGRLGALTARLHDHAVRWVRPAGFVRATWDPDTMIGPTGRWGSWASGPGVGRAERPSLDRLAGVLRARLDAFGRGPERFGLIHADLRLANLLADGDRPPAVIDFDDCGFSWWLYDLGTAFSFFEDDPAVPDLVERWLAGYRSVRPLPAADEAEVWTFVLLRRLLLLAWLGSHRAAPEAAALSSGFAAGTCDLAERYLSTHDVGLVTR